ncbi:MAG TPA: CinA family nicotinamide mononucleotide deamidase-related protein [Geomonas sp.]
MRIATLSIGDELLCGETIDTNAGQIAGSLYDAGLRVLRHLTVADDEGAIAAALLELAPCFDAVVVTGGLGPTPDDLTAAAAARAAGTALEPSPEALAHLARFAERIPGGLHPSNSRQALLPKGSSPIPNPRGTACGFTLRLAAAEFFFLPGVPFEMVRMLEDSVLPALVEKHGERRGERLTLKLFGISEAAAAAELSGLLPEGSPVQLAYCVKFPEIHLILRSPAQHGSLLQAAAAAIRERLGRHVFAEGEQTLDTVLASLFRETGTSLALAESCTGGLVAARITAVPGSSAWFLEGAVTYSNQAKARMLQVPAGLIESRGAVSAEVAVAMAQGARAGSGSDLALSITGIAGPDGGTPEKPAGTVFIAVADRSSCTAQKYQFPGDRTGVRSLACFTALDLLRRYLLTLHGASDRG